MVGIGRFAGADTIVPDPSNPQSFNRYSYVENSPTNFNDPSGHCKNGKGTGVGTCQLVGGPETDGYYEAPPTTDYDLYNILSELTGKDYVHACSSAGGPSLSCSPSEIELRRDFIFEQVDITLTNAEAQDLKHFIDDLLRPGNVVDDVLAEVSVAAGIIEFISHVSKRIPAGVGVGIAIPSATINYTVDDLTKLSQALDAAIAPESGSVDLTIGQNYFEWGIAVNGEVVIEHFDARLSNPMFNPKGGFNLTQDIVNYWLLTQQD